MLRTPKFWYRRVSWQRIVLWPLSLIVRLAGCLRFARPVRLPLPVICVGNIVAGGAGKTPTCAALGGLCKSFKNPGFLSRGYGGSIIKPTLVDKQDYQLVGDEPLILKQYLPTWISKDRVAGATAAKNSGLDLIIMDDGFQNPGFIKDLSFLVIDGHQGFGNGFVLPSGPLRETVDSAMARTDAVILINQDQHNIANNLKKHNKPLFSGTIYPDMKAIESLRNKPIIAFAGLGFPEKFFAMLRDQSLDVFEAISFPDHHPYTSEDIKKLRSNGKSLVTTRKDMIKIPSEYRDEITVIDIELKFDQPEKVQKFIREKII